MTQYTREDVKSASLYPGRGKGGSTEPLRIMKLFTNSNRQLPTTVTIETIHGLNIQNHGDRHGES